MIFTCTRFRGFYPVGTAAVVEAADAAEAERLLRAALARLGLRQDDETLTLTPFEGGVRVLCDGNY